MIQTVSALPGYVTQEGNLDNETKIDAVYVRTGRAFVREWAYSSASCLVACSLTNLQANRLRSVYCIDSIGHGRVHEDAQFNQVSEVQ